MVISGSESLGAWGPGWVRGAGDLLEGGLPMGTGGGERGKGMALEALMILVGGETWSSSSVSAYSSLLELIFV